MDSVWFEALVFILGAFLALFLILAIVLAVKLVQIAKVIKRITDQAEHMADRAEHIADFFDKTATPVALMKLIANVSDVFQTKKKRKK